MNGFGMYDTSKVMDGLKSHHGADSKALNADKKLILGIEKDFADNPSLKDELFQNLIASRGMKGNFLRESTGFYELSAPSAPPATPTLSGAKNIQLLAPEDLKLDRVRSDAAIEMAGGFTCGSRSRNLSDEMAQQKPSLFAGRRM